MAEIVACPNCERQLQIPENFYGELVQCPDCQHQFNAAPAESAVQVVVPISTPAKSSPAPASKPASKYDDDDAPRRRPTSGEDFADLRTPNTERELQPHRATLVLVMGILAICCVATPITGLIAWILGSNDLKEMDAGRMDPSGRGQTLTGKILGMASVILSVLALVAYCLIMVVGGAIGAFGNNRRRRF